MVESRKFPIGLSTLDLVKKALILCFIFLSAVTVICFMFVLVGTVLADEFSCMCYLLAMATFTGTCFALAILLLIMPLKGYLIKKGKNGVEIAGEEIKVLNTWDLAYPPVQNIIPIDNVKRIEPAGDDYFSERWKKTGWFHRFDLMGHKPPHGGLYLPMTSRKNLLIIYLFEPILISNTNFLPSRRPPLMKITEELVKEVIVDIDPLYHNEFIDISYHIKYLIDRTKGM